MVQYQILISTHRYDIGSMLTNTTIKYDK